jgi:hypothetical protein
MLRGVMTKASCLALLLVGCAPDKPADPAKKDAGKVATKADAKATDDAKKAGDAKAVEAKKADDAKADEAKPTKTWSFDDLAAGAMPPEFDPVQTGEKVDPPATWAVVADAEAPSPPNAFGVTKTTGVNKTFNTGLIKGTSYKDLEISVMLRPTSGANNQGGGVMFRAKGVDDHYIARWNPVENNFRIYALLGGARVDIAAAPLELDPKVWHNLRVTAVGDRIECFVDDKPIVQANDKSLPDAGMIGLWTKGDAATLFDDLTVTAE